MKVTKTDYSAIQTNDPLAIGITVKVEMGSSSTEQCFIVEDAEVEVGRVVGNMISQLAAIKDPEAVVDPDTPDAPLKMQISDATISKMRKDWRAIIRG